MRTATKKAGGRKAPAKTNNVRKAAPKAPVKSQKKGEAPVHETFGQRVKRFREAAGMASPSDLARAIWGEHTDARGFVIANNRDTIWRYESDRSVPSRKNLTLLAAALGVTENELDPERSGNGGRRSPDILEVRVLDRSAGKYRLVVDLEVDHPLAATVFNSIHAWLGKNPGPVKVLGVEEVKKGRR